MTSVVINGHTYSDDNDPNTGLAAGGHRKRLIPLCVDLVFVAGGVATQAASAALASSAASAAASSAGSAAASAAAASAQAVAAAASATAVAAGSSTGRITQRPAVLLAFAQSRAIDPMLTFLRASVAWAWGRRGYLVQQRVGIPSLDYDPATGECRGVFMREARTSLMTNSSQVSGWIASGLTSVLNTTDGIDGAVTADTLTESATTGVHFIKQQALAFSAGSYVVATAVVKRLSVGSERNFSIVFAPSSAFSNLIPQAVFVLSGAGTAVGSSGAVCGIRHIGGGRYECWAVAGIGVTSSTGEVQFRIAGSGASPAVSYAGDGVSGLLFLHGQAEIGSGPASLIPTTPSNVTRAADVLSMSVSGKFGAAGGGLQIEWFADYTPLQLGRLITLGDGSESNRVALIRSSSGVYMSVVVGGVELVSTAPALYSTPRKMKAVISWDGSFIYFAINGILVGTYSLILPSFTIMQIGCDSSGVQQPNCCISKVALYAAKIAAAQMIATTVE